MSTPKLHLSRHMLDEIVVGDSVVVDFVISGAEMLQFAQLSGDENPLHCDDNYAIRAGYSGRVVYGALQVAKLSGLIGMALPGELATWVGLQIDFHKPLLVDEPARLIAEVKNISVATRMMELSFAVYVHEKKITKGTASILVRSSAP